MHSSAFKDALVEKIPHGLSFSEINLPFPDVPITQRSKDSQYSQIKEFQGESEQIIEHVQDAIAMITHAAPLTDTMLDQLPKLKFVGVSRGGPVNVDRAALNQRGIRLVNTPGRNASAVAEFTIGVLLGETRNIAYSHEAMKKNIWSGNFYRADVQRNELSAMTIGLVGYSHIGKRVGQLLKAFSSRILVTDPYVSLSEDDINYGVKQVDLEILLAESDAVSLHLPETPETVGLFDQSNIEKMKPGAVLINTARGSLVDEPALIAALQSGHLSGAALDTFAKEPLPNSSILTKLPNVLLTSHIAGASKSTVTIAANMIAEDFRRFINNEPAINLCP
ncbi:MAG: 2-hydroxyacid dehydrogenase [Gammaproteobacteria bacterium]|nr:2-hydroxyacid dehydrogenase [Gammaproteobacteria bacterium]